MIKSKKRLTILLSVAMAAALSLTTLSAVPFGAKADDTYATISEEMKMNCGNIPPQTIS